MSLLLTISIPTRNRKSYLVDLVESLRVQLTSEVELAISDNASTDQTSAYLAELKSGWPKGYSFIFKIQKENIGFEKNVLEAVSLASGEYVWTIGDDDIVERGAIEKILRCLKEGNYVSGVVNFQAYSLDLRNKLSIIGSTNLNDDKNADLDNLLKRMGFFYTFISIHIFKRSLWLEVDLSYMKHEKMDIIQFYAPMIVASKGNNFIIGEVLIRQRSGNQYDWSEMANTDIFQGWVRTFIFSRQLGVSAKTVDHILGTYVNRLHLARWFLHKKLNRIALNDDFYFSWKFFKQYAGFWFSIIPIYIMPPILLTKLLWLWKFLKKKLS